MDIHLMQLSTIFGGLPVRLLTRVPSRHSHHLHKDSCLLSPLFEIAAFIVLIACHDVTTNLSSICRLLAPAQKGPSEKSPWIILRLL